MAKETKIQWTEATWNIARGCTKVDADCKYCYMYRNSEGLFSFDAKTVTKTKTVFNQPLKIKEPSKIFASSLTDFFHTGCDSFRPEAWDIIRQRKDHTYQILTKRPERILDHLPTYWPEIKDSIWMGTSIGSQAGIHRLRELVEIELGCLKILSLEPLHGPIDLGLKNLINGRAIGDQIDWVIIGGESGNENGQYKYRPCEIPWIESLISQCRQYGIPVFVKQLGTHLSKKLNLSDRHGGNMDEWPLLLQIREFPIQKPNIINEKTLLNGKTSIR